METASQDLRKEHTAILAAMEVLEKMHHGVENDKTRMEDIREMINFLKLFTDKCHHGKEEDYLFPALEEIGIRRKDGPIGVMLAEHEESREYIRLMNQSIIGQTFDKEAFVKSASLYINLLRQHIEKENMVLFQISDTRLPPSKQEELLKDFETLEREVIGEGRYEELLAMLGRFRARYLV